MCRSITGVPLARLRLARRRRSRWADRRRLPLRRGGAVLSQRDDGAQVGARRGEVAFGGALGGVVVAVGDGPVDPLVLRGIAGDPVGAGNVDIGLVERAA